MPPKAGILSRSGKSGSTETHATSARTSDWVDHCPVSSAACRSKAPSFLGVVAHAPSPDGTRDAPTAQADWREASRSCNGYTRRWLGWRPGKKGACRPRRGVLQWGRLGSTTFVTAAVPSAPRRHGDAPRGQPPAVPDVHRRLGPRHPAPAGARQLPDTPHLAAGRRASDPRPVRCGKRLPRRRPVSAHGRRPLPAGRRDRPRRHGDGPARPRPAPEPRPCRQGVPRQPRRPRAAAPLRRGGAGLQPVAAPLHRAGPRPGHAGGRTALLRHEAGQGPHPGRAAGGAARPRPRPAALPQGLRAAVPGGGVRPLQGRDPPRPEAVQRHGGRLRRGPGHGLGPRQGARRAGRGAPAQRGPCREPGADGPLGFVGLGVAPGQRDGHTGLHGAGAGAGPGGAARPPLRRLRPGRHPLRDPDRPAALRRAGRGARPCARRRGRTWPTPSPGWTAAGPTPS
jgi:hypothetical protein